VTGLHVGLLGGHERGVPSHVPPMHTSPVVHQSPSSQPLVLFTWTQPVDGLQLSFVHGFPSLQLRRVGPTQAPAAHTSPVVHALPSSHDAMLGALMHAPVVVLHESVVHGFMSLQSWGVAVHAPPAQTSPVVHGFPSLQGLVLFVCVHVPPPMVVHESVVQGLSQSSGVPLQTPPEHTSPVVQLVPSLHERLFGALTQPVAGSHESSVHALPSSQLTVNVPAQEPPEHVSPPVQALPSLHVLELGV
jgi:hypothetical protein